MEFDGDFDEETASRKSFDPDDVPKSIEDHIDQRVSDSEKAIKEKSEEIEKESKKESTKLAYKMLIAGASFGFLGNFLVAVLLNYIWKYKNFAINIDFLLVVIGFIAFFGCLAIVGSTLKKAT